jgi:outer membrane protein TolC
MVLTAYHGYLQSEAAVEIFESATQLTAEALRVNRLLAEAGKVTEDRVLRAQADDLAVGQQRAEAARDRNAARAWLNFLVNRPLTAPVDRAPEPELRGCLRSWQSATGRDSPTSSLFSTRATN